MSMDLRELYQEIIIDHNRDPRNHYVMEHPTHQANGFNPLCGDKLTVYAQIDAEHIKSLSFLGCGCAISQASASLMTEALQGKTISEAMDLFMQIHHMLTIEDPKDPTSLGKLAVLMGVRAFPARVKCASLAWHTLVAALEQRSAVVKTE